MSPDIPIIKFCVGSDISKFRLGLTENGELLMSLLYVLDEDDMIIGLPKEKFIECVNCGKNHSYLEQHGYIYKFLSYPLICFSFIQFDCECGHSFKIEDSVISQRVCRKTRFERVHRMRAVWFFRRCWPGYPVYLFCFPLLSCLLLSPGSITLPEPALLSNSFSFSLLITQNSVRIVPLFSGCGQYRTGSTGYSPSSCPAR